MSDVARELIDLLQIEPLQGDRYAGTGLAGEGAGRIFGGHVVAQALMAAYRTVPDDRPCHSLHAYFIRPGDMAVPVVYEVDRDRDGGSFTTRRVVASQNDRQIFHMSASFQIEEPGWSYQHAMPDIAGPEEWPDRQAIRSGYKDRVPEHRRANFMRERPVEVREVSARHLFEPEPTGDDNAIWFRMAAAADQSPQMQHCLLAYASDMGLLGSSLRPHGLTWYQGRTMTASLDHAMWFHGPVRFEDWHLYAMDAPFTGGARGFNRGSIFERSGRLVASCAQEGLIRPIEPKR